jgi:hypothetical protein
MHRVSSNFTLFLKFFIPVGWSVFFLTLTATLFLVDRETLPFLTSPYFKYPFAAMVLGVVWMMYRSVFKLQRVEMGPDYYLVTRTKLGPVSWNKVYFKGQGSLGTYFRFLQDDKLMQIFLTENPHLQSILG